MKHCVKVSVFGVFLGAIFPHLYSVQMRKNADQKKLRIRALFMQWSQCFIPTRSAAQFSQKCTCNSRNWSKKEISLKFSNKDSSIDFFSILATKMQMISFINSSPAYCFITWLKVPYSWSNFISQPQSPSHDSSNTSCVTKRGKCYILFNVCKILRQFFFTIFQCVFSLLLS